MHENHDRRWWLLCGLACLLAAVVYINAVPGDFLGDDFMLVKDNPYIKHPQHLRHLFSKSYYDVFRELTYRPICTLTFFTDYAMWGLNPEGFHITNILLHVLNVLLLFLLVRRLFGRNEAAFVAAGLFAVHPVQTEAVAGITFREDLLCLMFVLLAIHFYLNARSEKFRKLKWLTISVICFFLALFSKETAVVLPAVILAMEICIPMPEKIGMRRWLIFSVYAVATIFYLVFRLFLFRNTSEHWVYHGHSFLHTMNLVSSAMIQYFKLLVFPVKQCVQYLSSDVSYGFWGALFVLFLGFLMVLLYYKYRESFFGLFWFLSFLLPVSNIIPIGVIMAERYLYIPNAGFFIFVSILYDRAFCVKNDEILGIKRTVYFLMITLAISWFGVLTVHRNRVWKNEAVFWREATFCSPKSAIAHNNLGLVYLNNGDLWGAEISFNNAIRFASGIPSREDRYQVSNRAHVNLGIVYAREGKIQDARHEFETAIKVAPGYVNAHLNLAVLFMKTGKTKEAVSEFETALALDPNNLRARLYLTRLYLALGEPEKAAVEIKKILDIDLGNKEARGLLDKIKK